MKQACLAAAVVVVMAFSPAVAQQTSPDDNHLIVPGQQIGPIKLGGTIEDALAALGRPLAATDRSVGTAVLIVWSSRPFPFWSRLGAWTTRECLDPPSFSTRKCRILEAFLIEDMQYATAEGLPQYATAEGLHVGVLEQQVRDVLGEPTRIDRGTKGVSHALLYASGIEFWVSDRPGGDYQRVTVISVRPQKCWDNKPCG